VRFGTSPGVSPACRQSFVLDTGIPAAMDAVNSLALNTRARSNGAAEVESYHHFMRTGTGGGALEGDEAPAYVIYDAPGSTYRTFTTATYPKPGGGSWGTGDIVAGNLQMILAVQFDSALQFRFTSTWVSLELRRAAGRVRRGHPHDVVRAGADPRRVAAALGDARGRRPRRAPGPDPHAGRGCTRRGSTTGRRRGA
jgi:hypothetical protein